MMLRYWGKAQAQGGSVPDHPLVFHSLDVAACAGVYLERNPKLLAQFGQWLNLDPETTLRLLVFLLAVHDIGKFAENFQHKAPEIVRRRFPDGLAVSNSQKHHDEVAIHFFGWLCEQGGLPEPMRAWDEDTWQVLLTASFGHHGTPPPFSIGAGMAFAGLREAMYEASREIAREFFAWCAEKFLTGIEWPACDPERARLASWWIAGLAVLADWLGSNTTWFPYADEDWRKRPLDEYWEHCALPQARIAVRESGVAPEPTKTYAGPETLFRHLHGVQLRPAQALAAELPIADEPQVLFLEDATGSGKTEAALILAARLIGAGRADGFYFGLPTQATADQMFERIDLNLPAWFDDPARASIVLAHGKRDQVHAFLRKLDRNGDGIAGELDTASMRVTQWLAQSNKRALQAQIGVGTLDQALMAGLRVKHQSLRMLGLFRKVLLVDEVHSYDAYMTQVLCETLRLHAAAGGSAILLSATMSKALRSHLLDAYAQGIELGCPPPRSGRRASRRTSVAAHSLDYPLLTHWHAALGAQPQEHAFPAAAHSHRQLDIDYLSDERDVIARIERWLAGNQSIVWVRNTVRDAIKARETLAAHFGAERVLLFHSRFASVDRRDIQNGVLRMLGKNSDATRRGGRIIVTTQVFQESLDADVDQMICDLSFVDVMLQRFGRYRRHLRDANGNPLPAGSSGPDGREPGPVVVFGPDRAVEPDAAWYERFSRGAAKVYEAHGKLYLSARAIGDRIELPRQFRDLIEAVYGEDGDLVPEALRLAEDRNTGRNVAERVAGNRNAITLANGYCGSDWDDDERIGSRIGDSVEATLVRVEGDDLLPWARGRCGSGEDEWALSGIRLPAWWLPDNEEIVSADPRLAANVERLKTRWPALKYRLVLPLVADGDGWRCTLAGRSLVSLDYCDRKGLERQR